MSKEYEDYFKKVEGNQPAHCQIYFKSLQCKAPSSSGHHRYLGHIHSMKRTKYSENNLDEPMATASKTHCTIL